MFSIFITGTVLVLIETVIFPVGLQWLCVAFYWHVKTTKSEYNILHMVMVLALSSQGQSLSCPDCCFNKDNVFSSNGRF